MSTIEMQTREAARPAPARAPIEGPSAWIGANMRGREAEWTYRLSPAEVAEIQAATRAVQARGIDIADIRRSDFPLPTAGAGAGPAAR